MPRHARTGSESRPNRRPQSYAEPAHVYAQRVNDFYATVSQAQASIPHQDSGYDASFDTQPQPQPQTQVQPQLPPQMQMQPVEHIAAASANRAGASAWAPSDDRLLVASRIEGLNWSEIRRKHFPNKSPNACRKRHERLMERRNTDQWDGYKMQRLAKEYMSMRKEIWEPLAARTGEKWSFVEHKCMSKGLKNIQSAARAASSEERRVQLDHHSRNAGYDDDSGVSGIGLTPADDADQYSSPDDCLSANQSFATVATGALSNYNQHQHQSQSQSQYHHQQHHQQHQQQALNHLQPIDAAQYAMHSAYGNVGYPANHHRYSSSVSSSASISHPFVSKGGHASREGSSPYLDDHRLM